MLSVPLMPLNTDSSNKTNDTTATPSSVLPECNSAPRTPSLLKRTSYGDLATISAPKGVQNGGSHTIDIVNAPGTFPDSKLAPATQVRNARSQESLTAADHRSRENISPQVDSTSQKKPLRVPRHIPRRAQIFRTASIFNDRFRETPTLPPVWAENHDRAICVLDARNYSLPAIVMKIRRTFPELAYTALTPAMIDKRLRILDQRVELDYWAIGLRAVSKDKVGFTVGEGSLALPYGGRAMG